MIYFKDLNDSVIAAELMKRRLSIIDDGSIIYNKYIDSIDNALRGNYIKSGNYAIDKISLNCCKSFDRVGGPEDEFIRNCLINRGAINENGNILVKSSLLKVYVESCRESYDNRQIYQNALNSHMETAGYHHLYSLERNSNKYTSSFAAKSIQQKQAVEIWSNMTGLSKNNILMWIDNGIIAANKVAGKAIGYSDSIDTLIEGAKSDQNNSISASFLSILPGILTAIASAASAAALLVQSLNQKDQIKFDTSLNAYGTESFGPQIDDFFGSQKETKNNILYAALFAGGLYFLTTK